MDEAYRQAQREAQSGDIGAQTRYLQMRRRVGEINDDQLWVAGLLGDAAAAQTVGINSAHVSKTIPEMLGSWRLLDSSNQWDLYAAAMRTLRTRLAQVLSEEAEHLRSTALLENQPTRLALQEEAAQTQAIADALHSGMFQTAATPVHLINSPITIRFDTLIEDAIERFWQRVGSNIVSIPIQMKYRARITHELQQLAIQRVYARPFAQFCRC